MRETFLSHLINVLKPELMIFVVNLTPSCHFCEANPYVLLFSLYKFILFIKGKMENSLGLPHKNGQKIKNFQRKSVIPVLKR